MGAVLTSDMPGTEEFEGMDDAQLDSALTAQENAQAKGTEPAQASAGDPSKAPDTASKPAASAEGPKAGDTAAEAALAPKVGDSAAILESKVAELTARLENLSREAGLGKQRALEAKLDKALGALERLSQAPAKPASPEEQARLDQEAQAETWLKQKTAPLMQSYMQEHFGHLIPVIQRQVLANSIQEHVAELGLKFQDLDAHLETAILEDKKAADAGDQAAIARMTALVSGAKPTELVFRAYRKSQEAAAAKAAETAKVAGTAALANDKAAAKGGRAIKPSGSPSQDKVLTKEDLEQMTEEEREKLTDEQLEAALPVQRGRGR